VTDAARILVVEDNVMLRRMLSEYLLASGFAVFEAGDGGEAVAVARREHPRLILMDIQLPTMSGLDATRAIRADPDLAGIAVIALTGFVSPEMAAECREAGCDDYITKPYDMDALLARIHQRLA
jgi:CheY-like chemotaxis protein